MEREWRGNGEGLSERVREKGGGEPGGNSDRYTEGERKGIGGGGVEGEKPRVRKGEARSKQE